MARPITAVSCRSGMFVNGIVAGCCGQTALAQERGLGSGRSWLFPRAFGCPRARPFDHLVPNLSGVHLRSKVVEQVVKAEFGTGDEGKLGIGKFVPHRFAPDSEEGIQQQGLAEINESAVGVRRRKNKVHQLIQT